MSPRTVLITGASTGIGAATAKAFASRGDRVFAGVRSEADGTAIGTKQIEPVLLDVTLAESIEAAQRRVLAATGARLDVLVNNAGIVVAGPLEFVSLDDIRRGFEVNVFGALAMTQAFLPALRAAGGRIVNVGSISGRFSAPFLGPYSATKFALRALCDALRVELHPQGVKVVLIAPGAIDTPLWQKSAAMAQAAQTAMPSAARALYGTALNALERGARFAAEHAIAATVVSSAIVRAVEAKHPRAEYLIGKDAAVQAVFAALPAALRDAALRKLVSLGGAPAAAETQA